MANSVKQRIDAEYVLERIFRFEIFVGFAYHVCRRKKSPCTFSCAQLETVFFWCCCALKGGLIFNASVHVTFAFSVMWHHMGYRPSTQQTCLCIPPLQIPSSSMLSIFWYFEHPPGTQQDLGASVCCVLRALRRCTLEQHQLGHRPGARQHPRAGVFVFLQNFRCVELG